MGEHLILIGLWSFKHFPIRMFQFPPDKFALIIGNRSKKDLNFNEFNYRPLLDGSKWGLISIPYHQQEQWNVSNIYFWMIYSYHDSELITSFHYIFNISIYQTKVAKTRNFSLILINGKFVSHISKHLVHFGSILFRILIICGDLYWWWHCSI